MVLCYLSFCEENVRQSIEAQVNGALDDVCKPLEIDNLFLESVVKVDMIMKDPCCTIPIMEKVFKQRFNCIYPARKTIFTEFANKSSVDSLQLQIDAIA